MLVPERHGSTEDYRYGFNGMEKDDEIKGGEGNSYTTEFRQYDPRVGRWLSLDPISMAWESPYAAFRNNPIVYNDPKGDCPDCNSFTTPSGTLMYASNQHYLWSDKGELIEKATDIAYRITANDIDFHWNQKLEGYYSSDGNKYSNPDSVIYDGVVLGMSELGKEGLDLIKNIITDLGGTAENFISSSLKAIDLYMSPAYSPSLDKERNEHYDALYEKVKNMDGTDVTKAVTKVAYGILLSKVSAKKVTSETPNAGAPFDYGDLVYDVEVEVYHKGNLADGKVMPGKALSTGDNLNSVSGIQRTGIIHKFSIPKTVYDKWYSEGLIDVFEDLDFQTGVRNKELRFSPEISEQLNKYKTYGSGE